MAVGDDDGGSTECDNRQQTTDNRQRTRALRAVSSLFANAHQASQVKFQVSGFKVIDTLR